MLQEILNTLRREKNAQGQINRVREPKSVAAQPRDFPVQCVSKQSAQLKYKLTLNNTTRAKDVCVVGGCLQDSLCKERNSGQSRNPPPQKKGTKG